MSCSFFCDITSAKGEQATAFIFIKSKLSSIKKKNTILFHIRVIEGKEVFQDTHVEKI